MLLSVNAAILVGGPWRRRLGDKPGSMLAWRCVAWLTTNSFQKPGEESWGRGRGRDTD